MKLQLQLNEDVEFYINKRLKKDKKLTPTKLINEILLQWCEQQDCKSFPKQEQINEIPRPDNANLDSISLEQLKKYVDSWYDTYGGNQKLINTTPYNISYELEKD